MTVTPFKIEVPESVLNDLRARLEHTRWPDEVDDSGWNYGTNLSYIKELAAYWLTTYDWRAQERAINQFPQFQADVSGHRIHFIHQKGRGRNPLPIILTHGWPSSFVEMLKLIPLLTDPASHGGDPADAFDVIVPSLPGYGFSERPSKEGMNICAIAKLWNKLMLGLGYSRFIAQGGDWGAYVSSQLGLCYPKDVEGIHLSFIPGGLSPYLGPEAAPLTEAEKRLLTQRANWAQLEGGYEHLHGTKSQTISYALNDSPIGLASWVIEKFRNWSDCNGEIENRFTKDELLTNIMVYWVTETIGSSIRLYSEAQKKPGILKEHEKVTVPTAVAIFPAELSHPPKEWGERLYNISQWSNMPRGGHFAAAEEPTLLADDIRRFCTQFRR